MTKTSHIPISTETKPRQLARFFRDWLWYGVVVTPLIIFGLEFAMNSHATVSGFFKDCIWSLSIGEFVLFTCLSGSYLLNAIEERFYKFKGWTFIERSDHQHIVRSMFFVLPGLYLAFNATFQISIFFGGDFQIPSLGGYKQGIIISVLVMLIHLAIGMKKTLAQMAEEKSEVEKESLKSQVKALSAQMNPHLLFNALNSVASAIQTDPDAAEEMTIELSELYRKILNATKQDTHSIQDELEICRLYLQIEKMRFTDRLEFEISAYQAEWEQLNIPTLLIQPLVENAIKHGITQKAEGGKIEILVSTSKDLLSIQIKDNGVGFGNSNKTGSNTSLANCKRRLELAFGPRSNFSIDGDSLGTNVIISIPRKSTP